MWNRWTMEQGDCSHVEQEDQETGGLIKCGTGGPRNKGIDYKWNMRAKEQEDLSHVGQEDQGTGGLITCGTMELI